MKKHLLTMLLMLAVTSVTSWVYGQEVNYPSADVGFFDDFEGENTWTLINGTFKNQWCIGTATAKDGNKSLYISDDGGVSWRYSGGYGGSVYTSKAFAFGGGEYTFSFDWKAYGEGAQRYDFLGVYIGSADYELVASYDPSIPSDWIDLGGGRMHGAADWTAFSKKVTIAAGNYQVVFLWHNDGSVAGGGPGAIDNFRIGDYVPSGITTVRSSKLTDNKVYTLDGCRVEQPAKPGVYVTNGRKVVVK